MEALARDCEWLQRQHLMDYSLLVGVRPAPPLKPVATAGPAEAADLASPSPTGPRPAERGPRVGAMESTTPRNPPLQPAA